MFDKIVDFWSKLRNKYAVTDVLGEYDIMALGNTLYLVFLTNRFTLGFVPLDKLVDDTMLVETKELGRLIIRFGPWEVWEGKDTIVNAEGKELVLTYRGKKVDGKKLMRRIVEFVNM